MSDLSTIDDLTVLFDEFLFLIDGGEISTLFDDLPNRTKTLHLFNDIGWIEAFKRQFSVVKYTDLYDDYLIDAIDSSRAMAVIVRNCLDGIKSTIGDNLTCFHSNRINEVAIALQHEWFSFMLEYVHESSTDLADDLAKRMGVVYD